MSGHRAPNLLLNDEQQMLSKTAQEFIRERAPAGRLRTFRDSKDEVGFSRALWGEMADLGWLGLPVPEEYGGLGLGFFDLCVVLEQTGRELMPEPFISTLLLGTQALLLGGTDAQRKDMLPGVVSGETLLALGYDEGGHPVTATKSADGFVLRGEKAQVLDGHVADRIIVSAVGDAGATTLFLVDPASDGVTVTRQHRVDGLGAALVSLDGVKVTLEAVVGGLGDGASLLELVLDRASVGVAAQMLGASEQAFEDTLAYIKEREQFGVPIGSFQALQHRAVSVFTDIALARSAVLAAARTVDEFPDDVPRAAALAATLASETFLHAAKEGIQMHGGIGVTDEHDIGFYMKRAHAAHITFGKPAQRRERWAELHGY
jgi:acyl-CoA dehydrogenase